MRSRGLVVNRARDLVRPVAMCIIAVWAGESRAEDELRAAVAATGVSEAALAAACVDAGGVHSALNTARQSSHLVEVLTSRQALKIAEHSLADARSSMDPLDPDQAGVIASAEADVEGTRAAYSTAVEAFVEDLLAPMSESQRARIRSWRSAAPGLPPEFRVKSWSAEERSRILAALLDERLAQTQSAGLSGESASVLTAARACPEVVQSSGCLAANLAEVTAAFRDELSAE